jgi:hypothetical protein
MGYRRSSVPNLYRDERTAIYYVRTKVHGRTIWKTLQTDDFRVAKLPAPKELADLQKRRNALSSLEKGLATFGNLAEPGTKDPSVTRANLTICDGLPRTATKFTEPALTIQSELSGLFSSWACRMDS